MLEIPSDSTEGCLARPQAVTLQNKSVEHSPQPASFSSLPPELRQEIWSLTFEPRILQVHVREGRLGPSGRVCVIDTRPSSVPRKVDCVLYNLTLGIEEEPAFWRQAYDHETNDANITRALYGHLRFPRGPVALEVCRESRKVAMKRYTLAFEGRHMVDQDEVFQQHWTKSGYGGKKAWVDFQRDTFYLWGPAGQICGQGLHRLGRFAGYMAENANMIRRLAVMGFWDLRMMEARGRYRTTPTIAESALSESMLFGGLKELYVMARELGNLMPIPMRGAAAELVRARLVDALQRVKETSPECVGDLPAITMVGDEWDAHQF